MYNKLLLLCSGAISSKQHGLFANNIFSSFGKNRQLNVIYLDFRKAFDLINHFLLKLRHYNLSLNMILWIGYYLSDRFSCVRINGGESREYMALSGVPQGSHLGPLLFLLFINDFPLVELNVDMLLFADDIKLFFEMGNVRDFTRLQNDLNKLIDWCTKETYSFSILRSVSLFHFPGEMILFLLTTL